MNQSLRAGPAISTTARSLLAAGQTVTVVAFSTDRDWSHISAPQDGWVNNAFILFHPEEAPVVYTVIKVEHAQTIIENLNVRSGPGTSFAIIGKLGLHQAIEIVATTQDKRWKQVITPVQGWVSTEFVQVSAACGDKLKVSVAQVSYPRPSPASLVQGQDRCNTGF